METFKRIPTVRMLASEVRDTTVEMRSDRDRDKYTPAVYLSPTGAEVNRVLISGTAVEKDDVGKDNSFWRLRVADPTGAVFVYAGQYQPEAAKAIRKLEVPCFVIVSGKLAHYNPEQGGDTIVSIRAESIAPVSIELRDLALADIANHTVRRLMEVRKNEKVREYYPDYEYNAFVWRISILIDQILEEPPSATNVNSCTTPAAPPFQPVLPSAPAVIPTSQPPLEVPNAESQSTPALSSTQEPVKIPDTLKPERDRKKGSAKNASPDRESKEISEELTKEFQEDISEEAPEIESKPGVLQDSASFVLDILRTRGQEPDISRDTIQNVLRGLGYAMLDIDSILEELKSNGEIIEPRDGIFRAV